MKSKKNGNFDVAIVGTGPAGIFAALELSKIQKNLKVVMYEKGKHRKKDEPNCSVTSGFGGSGAFSDGKLNHTMESGGQLNKYLIPNESDALINYVDEIYLRFGGDRILIDGNDSDVSMLKRKAAACDLKMINFPIRHLGTDKSRIIVDKMKKNLEKSGVVINVNTEVVGIKKVGNDFCLSIKRADGECCDEIIKNVIIAPGREGAQWFSEIADKLRLKKVTNNVDIGVRVEVSDEIIKHITDLVYELKVLYKSKSFQDQIRTFCMCPSGLVAIEEYKYGTGLKTVNGHTPKEATLRSKNTNFAILVSKTFTEPFKNPLEYAQRISGLANNLAGGGVLVQRLGDFYRHRRSTQKSIEENFIVPTLKNAVPGDLSLVLPYRHMIGILEILEALNKLVPGVGGDHTLLYGVEVKFYSNKVETKDGCETMIDNLYAAGDGSGYTRGLMQASMHGVLVARKLAENLKK